MIVHVAVVGPPVAGALSDRNKHGGSQIHAELSRERQVIAGTGPLGDVVIVHVKETCRQSQKLSR